MTEHQNSLSKVENQIKLEKALQTIAKKRCFVCDKNTIETTVSMFTKDGDEVIWVDVPSCQECKSRLEQDE